MAGIGTINDVITNLPSIFYTRGQRLWNRQAVHTTVSKKRKGRGPAINWTVSNGGNPVLNRNAGYTVTPSTDVINDDRVKLTLNRGIYSASFGFTDSERATVESYLGSDAASDMVKDLFQDAYLEHLAALMRAIELDLLTGTGTANGCNNIVGFAAALGTSGTYAGQTYSSSVNPGMVSNVTTSVGNITRALVRQKFAAIRQATGSYPDYVECSPLTATYLNGISDSQIRFPNDVLEREIMNQGVKNSRLGTSSSSILGRPILENTAWGASTN